MVDINQRNTQETIRVQCWRCYQICSWSVIRENS